MASIPDTADDEIRRLNRDAAKLEAETRKLVAEAGKLKAEEQKLSAEHFKLSAEQLKLERDKNLSPWLLLAQGLIAGAALMGAGAALAKLLMG